MTETAAVPIRITFNQSRIKTYQRCPKQFDYKFNQLLQPKKKSRPLFMGSWVHACLEEYYKGGDWRIGHQTYVDEWNKLFEEEKAELSAKYRGTPLPEIVERIMRSYLFYYKDDGWEPYMVEQILEVETPLKIDGKYWVFKGRLDLIIKDEEDKLWLVDHKTASTIPPATAFHAMEPQLMLYPWAAKQQYGIELAGVIWNYVKSKPPTIPRLNLDGSLSKRKVATDYPTLYRFLKSNGYDPNEFKHILLPLRKKSDFLRRYRMPRERQVTDSVVKDVLSVVLQIDRTKRWVRNVTRDCARMCAYHDLCRAELNGFDTTRMRETDFVIAEEDYVSGGIADSDQDDLDEDSEE